MADKRWFFGHWHRLVRWRLGTPFVEYPHAIICHSRRDTPGAVGHGHGQYRVGIARQSLQLTKVGGFHQEDRATGVFRRGTEDTANKGSSVARPPQTVIARDRLGAAQPVSRLHIVDMN